MIHVARHVIIPKLAGRFLLIHGINTNLIGAFRRVLVTFDYILFIRFQNEEDILIVANTTTCSTSAADLLYILLPLFFIHPFLILHWFQ